MLRVERRNGHAIPQPREDNGGGFAEASGDADELRTAINPNAEGAFIVGIRSRPTCEAALIGVGCRAVGGSLEEI